MVGEEEAIMVPLAGARETIMVARRAHRSSSTVKEPLGEIVLEPAARTVAHREAEAQSRDVRVLLEA